MQVLFSPSSPPPTPKRTSKTSHSHRHISFKAGRIPRALTPTSEASFPSVGMVTASNSSLGTIDLTRSPATSPCSSNTALSRSSSHSSAGSNSATPKASRSRSPAVSFPPPSFLGFHNARSAPSLPAPPRASASTHLAPRTRPESPPPHRRATFLLPGDGDSDRERDRDCDRESAQDDSDDSDRTSFFSAEEFVVPVSALHEAVTAGGRVLDAAECVDSTGGLGGWQSQAPPAPPESAHSHDVDRGAEQGAAHEIRRWHALMEIVHSEVGYVRDLRILVNVYLSLLPTLPLSSPVLEAVQDLTQDAVDLLELHERFSRTLEVASAPVAGGESPRGTVDQAVKQLAGLFVSEASAFDLYQRFCSTQPDVMRLLRHVQARGEWAAFERRCALGGQDAADLELPNAEKDFPIQESSEAGPSGVPLVSPPGTKTPSVRALSRMPSAFKPYALSTASSQHADPAPSSAHRRHSYDSFAGVFGTGSGSLRHRPNIVRPLSDSPASSTASQSSRLRFHDFLIKPVQRICKYPLMLEGLRSKVQGDATDAVVVAAVESMRGVATRVDEARRQRESAVKSKLIVERTEPHPVVTPDFLASLGDCLLAGSLDVVHHHQTLNPISTPVRVKYLGGFLYLGGYLLLVKVGKGKTYRVKHWFSLAPFEIVDISPDTALVPSSFRLSYMGHHFEIAVACQREKDLWLRAINEARNASAPRGLEPVSSLQILQTEPSMSPASDSDTGEAPVSIKRGSSSASVSDSVNPLTMLRLSSTRFRSTASTPTPAVRYIFSHTEESSILLHRSSSRNRNFVDQGLSDVLSDLISGLRKQAQSHQEMLFPPPQHSDASQTIAIAAKNKLMRRGSVLVARPRAHSPPDATGSAVVDTDRSEEAGPSSSTLRPKTMATYCRRMSLMPSLGMLYSEPESIKAETRTPVELQYVETEHGGLAHKAVTRSLTVATGRHTPPPAERHDHNPHYHRRARSLVGSVKGLMRLGSTRSTNSEEALEAWRALHHSEDGNSDTGESTETGSRHGTGRRRVSSAPTSPPISSANSIFFPDSDQASSSTSTTPDSPFPPPPLVEPPSPPATSKLFRKKSASIPLNHDQTLKPRRSLKSFVFYNRLTAVDPA